MSQLAVWNEPLVQHQRNHQGAQLAAVHSETQHAVSHSSQELPVMQDTNQASNCYQNVTVRGHSSMI